VTVNEAGRIVRTSGVTIDVTDLKEAEERRTLLVREVDHRARNALAVVQSIVRLTRAKTLEAYVAAVEGRIRALSTAHVLLSESRWEGADLSGLVEEELAPYRTGDPERIVVAGPAVFLQPSVAQILALVLHELATNAAKYGALSKPSGKVRLSWHVGPEGLDVRWLEIGGPVVQAPASQGYGTRVIGASVDRQLGGSTRFDWQRDGLHFSMTVPLGDRSKAPQAIAGRRGSADADAGTVPAMPIEGNRVLLIEDEALVGMMMKDVLTELGFQVVGPFATMADATAAIADEDFHAAVLDVNLQGDLIYPLAEMIKTRGIPFVFVTGYSADGIDERFACVPILQKPVERKSLERVFAIDGESEGSGGVAVPSCWKNAPNRAGAVDQN
jgi:two-component sensor histidine kinase/CheY-like chemotaxis protein